MKVKINEPDNEFKPISINLIIETQDELESLFQRLNLSCDVVNEYSDIIVNNELNEFYKLIKDIRGDI
jgi:hypothetical protein